MRSPKLWLPGPYCDSVLDPTPPLCQVFYMEYLFINVITANCPVRQDFFSPSYKIEPEG